MVRQQPVNQRHVKQVEPFGSFKPCMGGKVLLNRSKDSQVFIAMTITVIPSLLMLSFSGHKLMSIVFVLRTWLTEPGVCAKSNENEEDPPEATESQRKVASLMACVRNNKIELITKMLTQVPEMVNEINIEGRTVLHSAVLMNKPNIVSHILHYLPDISKRDVFSLSPIHYAVFNNYESICELFFEYLGISTRHYSNEKDKYYTEVMSILPFYHSQTDTYSVRSDSQVTCMDSITDCEYTVPQMTIFASQFTGNPFLGTSRSVTSSVSPSPSGRMKSSMPTPRTAVARITRVEGVIRPILQSVSCHSGGPRTVINASQGHARTVTSASENRSGKRIGNQVRHPTAASLESDNMPLLRQESFSDRKNSLRTLTDNDSDTTAELLMDDGCVSDVMCVSDDLTDFSSTLIYDDMSEESEEERDISDGYVGMQRSSVTYVSSPRVTPVTSPTPAMRQSKVDGVSRFSPTQASGRRSGFNRSDISLSPSLTSTHNRPSKTLSESAAASQPTSPKRHFTYICIDQSSIVTIKRCRSCHIYMPPRCFHCRLCDCCVRGFDHHCPWIGNCIGVRNHFYFLQFMCYSVTALLLGLLLASWGIVFSLSHSFNQYHHLVFWFVIGDAWSELLFFLCSIFLIAPVGNLFFYHFYISSLNCTTHEEISLPSRSVRKKSRMPKRYFFPYNKGFWKNWLTVVQSCRVVSHFIHK